MAVGRAGTACAGAARPTAAPDVASVVGWGPVSIWVASWTRVAAIDLRGASSSASRIRLCALGCHRWMNVSGRRIVVSGVRPSIERERVLLAAEPSCP